EAAAQLNAPVILMHMRGEPRTMQDGPVYADVVGEVSAFLAERVAAARAAGLAEVWVDPGIGFGKTVDHNLALIRGADLIAEQADAPVLIGASRKSLVPRIVGGKCPADARLGGSIALALLAMLAGARMVRVHDVQETAQALRVWQVAT